MNRLDPQYIGLIRDIMVNGVDRPDRTGVGSRTTFGRSFTVDLGEGFPILTSRKVPFRIAFEETMFFLRGETDTKILESKNINIWKGNTTREFLDSRNLHHLVEGDMGKGYSWQWRRFGATDSFTGIDQVKELLHGLKHDPYSRRHIITAWNPVDLPESALPPCHVYQQYQVLDGRLNSLFFMRSNDVIYGLPFNIMGYAFLTEVFAKHVGLQPGTLTYMAADAHIYSNQFEIAQHQCERTWFDLPKLNINKDLTTLEDILSLEYSDIELVGYKAHPDFKNKPPMAV